MRNNHNRFNEGIYDSKLKFEHLFNAEKTYQQIMSKSVLFITKYMDIWTYVSSSEV